MQLRCAGNGNDPRLLRQQPGESDLCRRRLLRLGDFCQHVHEGLIGFSILRSEAGDDVAEIGFVKLCIFADLASEEALAERAERNEAYPEFLEGRYDFGLGLSPPK